MEARIVLVGFLFVLYILTVVDASPRRYRHSSSSESDESYEIRYVPKRKPALKGNITGGDPPHADTRIINTERQREPEKERERERVERVKNERTNELWGRPTREPFRFERINRGLATILNGVRNGNLEDILRGSFQFTRNNNVRGVSDQVISSVFNTPVRGEGNLDAFGRRTQ